MDSEHLETMGPTAPKGKEKVDAVAFYKKFKAEHGALLEAMGRD